MNLMNPIKQRRKGKGWTVAQLAETIGVRIESVYAWENGRFPELLGLRRLAEAFEVDHLDLVNELLDWQRSPRRGLARTR